MEKSPIMDKKICLITGANSGIGKAAAVQIMRQGYQVVLACRNQSRGEAAQKEINQLAESGASDLMLVDMSLQSSIRHFAHAFLSKYDTLDVLIHNAAAFDVTVKEPVFTAEGIESIWATNHVGPVLLTELLMDALKNSDQGRIITIASKGLIAYPNLTVNLEDPEFRSRKFSVSKAYYQSKLAQVMYTYWLAQQLGESAVTTNCIRVTNVKIDIENRYPDASWVSKFMYRIKSSFSISPEEMAETYTYLAVSPEVRNTSGKYFDDPHTVVGSNRYSKDEQQIKMLMDKTFSYIKHGD
jgi:NAD(P)-dependent dehydrogenase (short-subunit alcohol dehydrogenase family)